MGLTYAKDTKMTDRQATGRGALLDLSSLMSKMLNILSYVVRVTRTTLPLTGKQRRQREDLSSFV